MEMRPLSITFRIAAGLLFILGLPSVYFDILLLIDDPLGADRIGPICLMLFSIHISGNVLFTGFAPDYLRNPYEQ